MLQESSVRISIDGALAVLTLSRPERRNAIDREMVKALVVALNAVAAAPDVRAVVLTGAGDAFCAGWSLADIVALSDLGDAELAQAFEDNERALERLERFDRPTIAVVNGAVAGFGMSLVARCDFALAATDATFHLPEAALGLVPASVARDMISIMGRRTAFDWLALADRRSASDAFAAGLVRAVVDPESLMPAARAIAERLACSPAATLAELKTLLVRVADADDATARSLGVAGAVRAVRSPQARALIASARSRDPG